MIVSSGAAKKAGLFHKRHTSSETIHHRRHVQILTGSDVFFEFYRTYSYDDIKLSFVSFRASVYIDCFPTCF